jgi:hypothetical protein
MSFRDWCTVPEGWKAHPSTSHPILCCTSTSGKASLLSHTLGFQTSILILGWYSYPKMFFFITASKMVLDEQPTGSKNGGFLKTSQLHNCGFSYI